MNKQQNVQEKEDGFILITAMLILLVLTVMGLAVNRNTVTEWRIAMNDRLHKQTFYEADGATQLATEVLEQNIACLEFVADGTDQGKVLAGAQKMSHDINVDENSLGFWRNYAPGAMPSDDSHDFFYPDNYRDGEPHTNIKVAGKTKLTTGAAIMMAAGYEGPAKGIGVGGATLVFDINVQRMGRDNSESVICVNYNHVLGSEGDCYYTD